MSKAFKNKHRDRAELVANHRKQFLLGLIVVVLVGGLFGYYIGQFFFQFLETDPDHTGFPLGSWEAMRETFIAVMSVFSVIIWPAIFSGFYFVWKRRLNANLEAQIAIYDEESRKERIDATNRKIAEAQERGDLQKPIRKFVTSSRQ